MSYRRVLSFVMVVFCGVFFFSFRVLGMFLFCVVYVFVWVGVLWVFCTIFMGSHICFFEVFFVPRFFVSFGF